MQNNRVGRRNKGKQKIFLLGINLLLKVTQGEKTLEIPKTVKIMQLI